MKGHTSIFEQNDTLKSFLDTSGNENISSSLQNLTFETLPQHKKNTHMTNQNKSEKLTDLRMKKKTSQNSR